MSGEELRKIRISAQLTQAELAKVLDVTVTTISQWERDVTKIHPLMASGILRRTECLRE